MSGHYRILSFGKRFCVPRDGDDEEESPSPVEKGEGARLAGKGSTADVRPIHRPYGRSPFPFREGQKNISFCVPLQEGQLWYI